MGAQWHSGRVLDSRPKGRGLEPHQRHCVVSLSKNINPSLVLVQPRKTRPFITERLWMGRKESNQTNQENIPNYFIPEENMLDGRTKPKLRLKLATRITLVNVYVDLVVFTRVKLYKG